MTHFCAITSEFYFFLDFNPTHLLSYLSKFGTKIKTKREKGTEDIEKWVDSLNSSEEKDTRTIKSKS